MNRIACPDSQAGMVLLLCLIFLTALTLLGLSASADTILQNQLIANFQEAERSKQAALAALSWAEDWLLELDGPVPVYCKKPCDGLYVHSPGELPPHPEFESFSWWQDHGYEAGVDPLTGNPVTGVATGNINKPVWLIVAYAAVGALFMPFLAATLLYMNNQRKRMGALKNGVAANAGLVLSLGLFVFLAIMKIIREIL